MDNKYICRCPWTLGEDGYPICTGKCKNTMKIEYGEGCYGPFVRIDNKSVSDDTQLAKKLIQELDSMVDKLDSRDLLVITEIITSRGNFEEVEDESNDGDNCEQCGNWNYRYVFKTKE